MGSEEQQQGGRYVPNSSHISRDSSQLAVEEGRDVGDEFAAKPNATHNRREGGLHIENDASVFVQNNNHGESKREEPYLPDIEDFLNFRKGLPIKNPEVNDYDQECVFIEKGPAVLKTINNRVIINGNQNGLHLEADYSSERFNLSQGEASSSSSRSSLETRVNSEIRANPGKRRTGSATGEQTKKEQPGLTSFVARKSQRLRNQTVKFDQSDKGSGTQRKPRRKRVSTSSDAESKLSEDEQLELRQLMLYINPMTNELWQWATPAIFGPENQSKFYKRCCTGTPQAPILSFKLGDAVQLMAPDPLKYIGIVAELFQRHRREPDRDLYWYLDERVHTVWLYRKEDLPKDQVAEVCEKLKSRGLNLKAALFISQHSDVNPLQKVKRRIKLVSVEEYLSNTSGYDCHRYYLAGVYDSFWGKVYLQLHGNFSLPKLLLYDSLEQQALSGNRVRMPRTPSTHWFSTD